MSYFYPENRGRPLLFTQEQLTRVAQDVPPLPAPLSELSPTDAQEFLTERYGEGMQSRLEARSGISGISAEYKLALSRALDVRAQTDLFREPCMLRAMPQIILPALAQRNPIRIASVGCSTGEEALSILLTNWEKRSTLTIDGFDINPEVIEAARSRSWYVDDYWSSDSPASFLVWLFECQAQTEESAWSEAFTFTRHTAKEGRVDAHPTAEVTARLKFETHDILFQPLPTRYDILVLQNMLCHYTPRGRDEIMGNVANSLSDGAYFIGDAAVTLGNAANDPRELRQWYDALESYGLERVHLPVRYEWCQHEFDDTSSLFVYRARN